MTKEEAIKHLHTYSSTNGSGLTTQDQHEEAKKMAIKALETQPQWIPCSERLPDESGKYLVTIRYEDGYDTDLFKYNSHWREWNDGEMYGGNVIAWQQKPQPWEGGR